MALLIRTAIRLSALVLLLASCSVVDPLVIAESYSVQDDGKAEVQVRIEGGNGVSRLKQRDVIHDLMLDLSRDPSLDSAAFDAMLELEDLFEKNGYPLVEVKYRVERQKGTKVVFSIQQHKQVVLAECRVKGGSIDEETLLKYLPRRQSDAFGLGEELYIAADIAALRQGIVHHYGREGFLDVKVQILAPKPALTKDVDRVAVTIEVEQGRQFTVGKVELGKEIEQAIRDYSKTAGQKGPAAPRSPLVSGEAFRASHVQDYALALTAWFRRWGHPEPKILSTVEVHRPPHERAYTVSIRFHGTLGEPVVVERIDIEGNDFASIPNIRQRIEMRADERFDGQAEEKSLQRLYRSGLFRTVETEYRPAGPGRIVVVFRVRETTRYLVQPLIGAGSYERIRGGLEFEMLSLFGTDFDFNSKAILSDKGHRVSMSIADSEFWPELLGTDTTLSFALDDFEREEPSYTDGATGFNPSLAKLFTRAVSARIGYLIRDHGNTFSTVQDPGAQIGNYREGSLVLETSYDSRDNPIMPKRGTRLALQHKWADDSLGGEVSFHRTRVSASKVFELGKRTRFVMRGEAGFLEPESNIDTVPIQERFFNGGETTVRSFREDQLAIAELRDVNNQVIGGGYRNVFNAELRWSPRWRPVSAFDLEFALFGDAGNLGRRLADYDLGDMKYAVGAGIRFLLPIGPVRFDYAHNPDREPGERDWTFHFSIGYAF